MAETLNNIHPNSDSLVSFEPQQDSSPPSKTDQKIAGFLASNKFNYLKGHIVFDDSIKALSEDDKERVFELCLQSYQKSIAEYDRAAGQVAFTHLGANNFANELCKRIYHIVIAYNEVQEEKDRSVYPKEFMEKIRITQLFGNSSINPGSVGMNALSIKSVVDSGNLRERMTLVYQTIFSFLMNKIMADSEMIDKINPKLSCFKIDKKTLKLDTINNNGLVTSSDGIRKKLKQISAVEKFRHEEKGRISKSPSFKPDRLTRFKVSEIPGISIREKRTGTEYRFKDDELDALDPSLRWMPGKEWYELSTDSSFAKEAESLGGLPLLTGPSGTTDGVLHLSKYLGLSHLLKEGILACIGWMVPVEDHSLHEIRVSGNEYGLPYEGLPKDFSDFYCAEFQAEINQKLEKKGLKNPSYYFSSEFQKQAAQFLNPFDKKYSN